MIIFLRVTHAINFTCCCCWELSSHLVSAIWYNSLLVIPQMHYTRKDCRLQDILNFYDGFIVSATNIFIPIPDYNFCLGKVYSGSYFLNQLVENVIFFLFKIILNATMNTYVISIVLVILSTLALNGKTWMLFSITRFV